MWRSKKILDVLARWKLQGIFVVHLEKRECCKWAHMITTDVVEHTHCHLSYSMVVNKSLYILIPNLFIDLLFSEILNVSLTLIYFKLGEGLLMDADGRGSLLSLDLKSFSNEFYGIESDLPSRFQSISFATDGTYGEWFWKQNSAYKPSLKYLFIYFGVIFDSF